MDTFPGEHIATGQTGSALLFMAFLATLLASVFFAVDMFSRKSKKRFLETGGIIAYSVHVLFFAAAFIVFTLIIFRHHFEFNYVWRYTSVSLHPAYLFSSLWAGKEGSMMLWALFSSITGFVLIKKNLKSSFSLLIFSLIQLSFLFMLNGAFWDLSGSSLEPFRLLRDTKDFRESALAGVPDYLQYIRDGNGLNPLLQNPWMVIHPPVLFLGYSLCGMLFAAVLPVLPRRFNAARSRRLKPLAIAAAAILGAGLLLGGVWAYVDLSFGGFWAWDPVENASLVPWLLLIAALHMLPAVQDQPQSAKMAMFLLSLPFVFSLYASWMTRSGVLSTTSVHAFSGENRASELLIMTLVSFAAAVMTVLAGKKAKAAVKSSSMRSLLLFMAAMVILLSAFHIFFTTSYPVWNKLFGLALALPPDHAAFYNAWQLPFAVMMLLLLALTSVVRHGKIRPAEIGTALLVPLIASVLLTLAAILFLPVIGTSSYILLWASLLAFLSVAGSRFHGHRQNGFSFGWIHCGFGLFAASIVIAFGMSSTVLPAETNPQTDVHAGTGAVPLVKGAIVKLSDGKWVSYAGGKRTGDKIEYRLDFLKREQDKFYLMFTMNPAIRTGASMGDVMLPSVRSEMDGDYFAYLTEAGIIRDTFSETSRHFIAARDTLFLQNGMITAGDSTCSGSSINSLMFYAAGLAEPLSLPVNGMAVHVPGTRMKISAACVSDTLAEVSFFSENPDYVVLKIKQYSFIGLLWISSLMMFAGMMLLAIRKSITKN